MDIIGMKIINVRKKIIKKLKLKAKGRYNF